MNEDFISFELARKLKEKGFDCNEPFAMYNELGIFHPLYTSCDETVENCIFGNRGYYDYADFEEYDCVCPTISQALKWLRKEKGISLNVYPSYFANILYWTCDVISFIGEISIEKRLGGDVKTYEEAAIYGLEYVLDNLI
jgi:hypothetical protein